MKINNQKLKIYNNEGGFVITITAFFVLTIMLSIAIAMSSLIFYRQQIATNATRSVQSYYAAEAGIEDALMRLRNNPGISDISYNLIVGNATASVNIAPTIGGSGVIDSEGNNNDRIKRMKANYSIDSDKVSFFYGAQIGDGGLKMNNGSIIKGNVFSTGSISGGIGTVDNDVIIAGNGRSLDDITVKGNVLSYSCLSPAVVEGNLTYVAGGTKTCAVHGTTTMQAEEIPSMPLPISQAKIDEWKAQAANGGTVNGDITITNSQTQSLGPVKITEDLTVSNNAVLTITGTVHVLGDILISNNGTIKLDSSYGSLGGVLISDKDIKISNNGIAQGSGQASSYLLLLSTNDSDSAVTISNNADGAILYASDGGITINNGAIVKELTGYKVKLSNNAVVEYENGLQNVFFSTGPAGGWKVTNWEEQ